MNERKKSAGEAGEFALIDRIRAICAGRERPGVVLGIGDDTAVIEPSPGKVQLATCDIQVEGVHFRFDWISPYELGRRAIAVNLSDIASMGGAPTVALVSLAVPQRFPLADFDALFEGMRDEMSEHEGAIVGGNLARSDDKLVVDVFMSGEVAAGRLLTRSGARPGDLLCVTGTLGSAAAGLEALRSGERALRERFASSVRAHVRPLPRVREGQAIAASGMASAMIDVSDGLAADLAHLCEASGAGAEVDAAALPVAEETKDIAAIAGRDPLDFALHGGEDYELLFAWRAEHADRLAGWASKNALAVHTIGRVLAAREGLRLRAPSGASAPLAPRGWDHFKQGGAR